MPLGEWKNERKRWLLHDSALARRVVCARYLPDDPSVHRLDVFLPQRIGRAQRNGHFFLALAWGLGIAGSALLVRGFLRTADANEVFHLDIMSSSRYISAIPQFPKAEGDTCEAHNHITIGRRVCAPYWHSMDQFRNGGRTASLGYVREK
jgi:hypothetical protein